MLDFTSLRTPAEDGDLLVEPQPEQIQERIEANQKLLRDWKGSALDASVSDLRRITRSRIGAAEDVPLVLTGHQPDFIHPGVWAKQKVASLLSEKFGTTAGDLIVDGDVPDDTTLAIPTINGHRAEIRRVATTDAAPGRPFESIPSLSNEAVAQFGDRVRQAMGPSFDASLMPVFLAAMSRNSGAQGWVDQVIAGRQAIDAELGTSLRAARVSRTWPGWHAADLILNANRFFEAYNASLADYRRAQNIRSASRPIPDLRRDGNRIELPLWAYSAERGRRRLFIEPDPTCIRAFADTDPIGRLCVEHLRTVESAERAIADNLTAALRPRALVLTLWARLFACDLFIHGIGGAVYDRITDGIIRRFYRTEPPAYMCVSATLHLPFKTHAVGLADLRDARRRSRDLHVNPLRYLDPHPRRNQPEEALRAALTHAQQLRQDDPHNRAARRDVFLQIRELKNELVQTQPDLIESFAGRVREIEQSLAFNRIATGREYFIGLYPKEKLARLARSVRDRFA